MTNGPQAVTYEQLRSRAGVKWNKYGPDVIAAWVADMDFDPPPVVLDRMRGFLDRGDLGYNNELTADACVAFADWQDRHHGWRPDIERLRPFTSVLHALEVALWQRTKPGDGVVVFSPIYYPFLDAIRDSGRRVIDVQLDPRGWRIDADRLGAAIDATTSMVLFCQPHNPTGRMFDDDEVAAVAALAERHDLLVVSDEIWGDLTHGEVHRPLATVDDRFRGRLVTLGSASKSFNLAALRCAVAHIDDARLNDALADMPAHVLGAPSVLGVAGTLAAWTEGEPWLAGLRRQLTDRRDQFHTRLTSELPDVSCMLPEATYLGWMDFSRTALADDPGHHLLEKGKVALAPGIKYGSQAGAFARINFATSEHVLDDAIDRIVTTVREAS